MPTPPKPNAPNDEEKSDAEPGGVREEQEEEEGQEAELGDDREQEEEEEEEDAKKTLIAKDPREAALDMQLEEAAEQFVKAAAERREFEGRDALTAEILFSVLVARQDASLRSLQRIRKGAGGYRKWERSRAPWTRPHAAIFFRWYMVGCLCELQDDRGLFGVDAASRLADEFLYVFSSSPAIVWELERDLPKRGDLDDLRKDIEAEFSKLLQYARLPAPPPVEPAMSQDALEMGRLKHMNFADELTRAGLRKLGYPRAKAKSLFDFEKNK